MTRVDFPEPVAPTISINPRFSMMMSLSTDGSLRLSKEGMVPGMKRMIDLAHSAGAYVFHHDDGSIRRILPDFGALDLSPMVVLLAVIILGKILDTAIANAMYANSIKEMQDAAQVNPLSLWDTHHVRRIDDMGFVDEAIKTLGAR